MTPPALPQTVANGCVAIAALLYAVPLQHLLLELSRKRDDGGGVIAGLLILAPMWLLLLAAVLTVAAGGGFDWLRLGRTPLYVLSVLSILAMAVVSMFLAFEPATFGAGGFGRTLSMLPIHVFPVLTIVLVILSMNPRVAPGITPAMLGLPWTVLAAGSLVVCTGFVGYQLASAGGRQMTGLIAAFGRDNKLDRQNLARLPTMDPQRDFDDLLRLVDSRNRAVREAAIALIRHHPDWVGRVGAALTNGSVSGGEADRALAAVAVMTFTAEEQQQLALPVRTAMRRVADYTESELRYFTRERRRDTRSWGNEVFKAAAAKFHASGMDFQPAIDAFNRVFDAPARAD